MRRRVRRSRRAAKPSSANGGSSTAPSPTAWRKPATGSSPSPVYRRASGVAPAPRMRSNDCTRSSSEGSRRRPYCRPRTPLPCCSGHCSPLARSTCARSMAGRRSPQSSSISQLTSQPETISSCYRRSRHTEFQPHSGRHPRVRASTLSNKRTFSIAMTAWSAKVVTRADSMCCRSTSIACMSKIVGALVRCKRFYEFSNQPPEFLHGALGVFAQRSFEFRERHLDGIEVWRICRQIAECCTDSVDCLAYPVDLVGPQIIREHDVAFCQRWREHLLDIGHERGSIHSTSDDIRCSQAVDAQARNERQRFPVAVRDTRDEALATRSATGMANHFGRHRRLINKNEPLAP